MARGFTLYHPVEDDWEKMRELRLRMIADTPIAYLESLADAEAVTEQGWRERLLRNRGTENTQVIAVAADGRWVASMIAFISQGPPSYLGRPEGGPPRANLVGVFVDPDWRGDAGVTDAVLDAVIEWVRSAHHLGELYLHVSVENPRARRAYEKRGFVATGIIEKIPGDLSEGDAEMVKALGPAQD